jgi:aspartate/glutamate racemase
VSVPLLHLADTTADAVLAAGLSRVGLLGTAFTMEQDFYRDRLASHGLEVLVPEAEDRALVHRVIYQELCLGVVSERSSSTVPCRSSRRRACTHRQQWTGRSPDMGRRNPARVRPPGTFAPAA